MPLSCTRRGGANDTSSPTRSLTAADARISAPPACCATRAANATFSPKKSPSSLMAVPVWMPDPHAQRLPLARLLVERPLQRDRAVHRGARLGERHHEAVALRLDDVPVVLVDQLAHDGGMGPQLADPAVVAEAGVDRGRVLDVGEQQGDGPVRREICPQVRSLDRLEQGRDRLKRVLDHRRQLAAPSPPPGRPSEPHPGQSRASSAAGEAYAPGVRAARARTRRPRARHARGDGNDDDRVHGPPNLARTPTGRDPPTPSCSG